MTFHPTYREILIKNDTDCKLRILIKQKLELNQRWIKPVVVVNFKIRMSNRH